MLLIDCDAVSVFQITFHDGDVVLDFLTSLFPVDELRNVIHRSGTIQRIHGDNVLELAWFELFQILLHARRFKLERGYGVTVAEELVGGGIIDGNSVNIHVNTFRLLDVAE